MKRQISLEEVSDGKLYDLQDMVKVGCGDCEGCFACCKGMGSSIVLDPLDIYRLTSNLDCSLEQLLQDKVELNVIDGVILPNLKMAGDSELCCFLNDLGRCSIHTFRPGICRIFPLGRYYEKQSFQYFLQVHECKKANRTKVKVSKWIDTKEVKKYDKFISDWHYFLKNVQDKTAIVNDEKQVKQMNMYILTNFYLQAYCKQEEFYMQFYARLEQAEHFMEDNQKPLTSF